MLSNFFFNILIYNLLFIILIILFCFNSSIYIFNLILYTFIILFNVSYGSIAHFFSYTKNICAQYYNLANTNFIII